MQGTTSGHSSTWCTSWAGAAAAVAVIVVMVVVGVTTAGCTGGDVSQPRSGVVSAMPSQAGTSTLPAHGAPKVRNPVDPRPFPQEPCRLLTPGQAQQVGVPSPGRQLAGVTAPACGWDNLDSGATITVQFEPSSKVGLSRMYELRGKDEKDGFFFIEIPSIEGVPAVATGSPKGREIGSCGLWVGVTDELAFRVDTLLSTRSRQDKKDPCKAVETVAGFMIATMRTRK